MLMLDSEAAIASSQQKTEEATIAKKSAEEKRQKKEEAWETSLKKAQGLRAQLNEYSLSSYELKAMDEQNAKLQEDAASARKKVTEMETAFQESQPGFWSAISNLEVISAEVLQAMGFDVNSKVHRAAIRLQKARENALGAELRASKFRQSMRTKLGGKTTEEYLDDKAYIQSQVDIANKAVSDHFAEVESAREEESTANSVLKNAQEDEQILRNKQERLITSKTTTLDAEEKAKKEQEQRTKRLEKLQQQADKLSEVALAQKLEAAKLAEKNAKNEHEREYQQALQNLYRDKLNKKSETENEAIERANAAISSQKERQLMQKVDLRGAFATMDDDVLTIGELKKLRQEWKDANRAQNEEAVAIIRGLIEQAKNSKKTSVKTKNRIESLSW